MLVALFLFVALVCLVGFWRFTKYKANARGEFVARSYRTMELEDLKYDSHLDMQKERQSLRGFNFRK